ncbi:hypothetical protein [Mycobacterium sp. SMC-19]|uniref:hypothetical protein n=1 Tax=Mycobacterium sp. SMC-19 TaxID=3381630 RepID=UPI0038765177
MRLLSLDYDPVYGEGDETKRSSFGSDISVFDFDAVIWDPAASFRNYNQYGRSSFQGLPSLSDDESVRFRADITRRHAEFKEFLEAGRTIIAIVRPPQEYYAATGEAEYSGTGRNRQRIRRLAKVDLWDALPANGFSLQVASGNRITIQGDSVIASFLRKYKKLVKYDAVFSWLDGTPFASVAGTTRVVGSFCRPKAGGLLVLSPSFSLARPQHGDEDDEDDDDRWLDVSPEVQEDLMEAVAAMTSKAIRSRPVWSLNYATADQSLVRQEITRQESRIEAARAKLAKLVERRENADAKNQLFLGTGDVLASEVGVTLELLGGEVTQPDPDRDDWKVAFPEGNAVVEVKGVSKSAAEKHAAQLEKWVAGEFEETGIAPKGILIVNTWRDIDLSERVEIDFPDQMIPYCESRGHCLITGLQLFAIRVDVETNPSRAEYWRTAIMENSGILPGVNDWRSSLIATEDSESVT